MITYDNAIIPENVIAVDNATIPAQNVSFATVPKVNANPGFGNTFTNTTGKPIVLTWFLSIVVQSNSSGVVDANSVTINATNLTNYSNMSMRVVIGGGGLMTGISLMARGVLAPGATSTCSYSGLGGAYQIPSATFCPIPSPANLFDFS